MGWVDSIIDAGADIIGSVFSESGKEDPKQPKVSPSTVSGESKQTVDFLYDQQAADTMKAFTQKLNEWGDLDRSFMEDVYRPFQEELISTNTQLINMIGKNSSLALEQSIKDLTSSDALKSIFNQSITEMGANVSETASRFKAELDNLPTIEQRVGQAASAVEQQFGKAGADIRGRLKAQGLNVSQATERDLAIQKATAKAGAVGAAGEAARRERMDALATGTGVFQNLQTSQAGLLANQQALTQSGVGLTPQIGGVTLPDQTALGVGADLTASQGLQQRGVTTADKDLTITQAGAKDVGKFPGLDGGKLFNADGTLTDTGAGLDGKLTPEEMKTLQEFERDRFNPQSGTNTGETLKQNNPGLYSKIQNLAPSLIGGAVGIFAGPFAGAGAKKLASNYFDPMTGQTTRTTQSGEGRSTGSGAGTGGGRGGEHETESDPSGGMGGV